MPIRLGLLGAASITPRSVIGPARKVSGVSVHSVAASDMERAVCFARKHDVPHVFGDYDSLLACKDVDAVYIALPNSHHARWCIAAARAGKHILVEKPLCLNSEESERIRQAVRDNRVELMEGLMTQHHPWESRLSALVRGRHLGELLEVKTVQTFRLERSDNYRFARKYGGGVFLDEACYWIRLLQTLDLLPLEWVHGEASATHGGEVDTTYRVEARARGGVKVDALFSYDMPYEATHHLTFTDGRARIRNFLAPSLGDFRIKIEMMRGAENDKEVVVFEPENYFVRQLDFFAKVVRGELANVFLEPCLERIGVMADVYVGADPPASSYGASAKQ